MTRVRSSERRQSSQAAACEGKPAPAFEEGVGICVSCGGVRVRVCVFFVFVGCVLCVCVLCMVCFVLVLRVCLHVVFVVYVCECVSVVHMLCVCVCRVCVVCVSLLTERSVSSHALVKFSSCHRYRAPRCATQQ
jgi:hypothetical protein